MPFFVCARHGRAPVEPMDYRVSNAAQSGARSRDLYLKPLLLDFVVKSEASGMIVGECHALTEISY